MAYGIDATGWNAKPLSAIKADLEASFRTTFGNGIDLSAGSVWGQLIGLYADRLADLWQLGQGVYASAFPDSATGAALDALCALTGTARKPATKTQVSVTCSGTNGTVIAAGKRVSLTGIGTLFEAVTGGTIGASPTAIDFQAVNTGPLPAPAGTLTTIETPVTGWTSATNPLDQSVLGTDIETDAALRLRRELSLRALGGASLDAIAAKVREVAGVTAVYCFENTTESTDANGLPPHSFEVVAIGGTDAAIAAAIFGAKTVGVAPYGTTTVSVADSNGISHTIKLSRPATLNVYVTINVSCTAAAPSDVATQIAAAVTAYGDLNYTIGSKVISAALVPSVFAATPGIVDVQLPLIGLAASPTLTTTITPTNRQICKLDTSRFVVNVMRV